MQLQHTQLNVMENTISYDNDVDVFIKVCMRHRNHEKKSPFLTDTVQVVFDSFLPSEYFTLSILLIVGDYCF